MKLRRRPGRWCFSTLGCPQLTLDEALSLAESWGFKGVELRALEGSVDLVEVLGRRYGEPERLAKAMQGRKVQIAALDASLRLRHSTQLDREELLALARWADALGVERLRVFDGGRDEIKLSTEARDDMLRTLDWWQRERQRRGIHCDLMVETHWILTHPESCYELVRSAPMPVAILWDSFHTWAHAPRSLEDTWELLSDAICHIHFRDGYQDEMQPEGATYTLPGEGDYPLETLFALLEDNRYSNWLSLEWERFWHPELPPLQEALVAGHKRGLW